jgi:glycosyltransferase involved in cell wall biosynthesis
MLLYIIKKEKGNIKNIYKILKAYKRIKSLKLFDADYYLKKYPKIRESKIEPLDHYIYHGYKENKNPSENFDGTYYLKKNLDVKNANQNPLLHYVLYGMEEGRFPNRKKELNSLKHRLFVAEKKIKELEKYNRIYKLKSINKEKISSKMENFKDYGVTKEKRETKLIVSLTSYPDRMYDVHYTLYSLLTQNLKPDEVILWLAKEEFPNLDEDVPKRILSLKNHGLSIKWCEDIKSYKKLIFALKEYPEDIIITADDDVFYPKNWLELLYNEYDGENIVCHRAHLVNFDKNTFSPYSKWKKLVENGKKSFLNFFTGSGGVLYPPNSLYKDVMKKSLFMKLAPQADDIWFWTMVVLNNRKIKILSNGFKENIYVNPERELNIRGNETLYITNKYGGNDEQLKNIVNCYPELINKLTIEKETKISIIIPVYNAEKYLKKCLDSVTNQTLKDIEIICVNDGSTDDSLRILESYAKVDKRITIITQKNQGVPSARNRGLNEVMGEYVAFVDSDDWIDLNFYNVLYNEAVSQNADLVRTTYKYNFIDKEIEEKKLNQLIKRKKSSKESLNVNDHSVVIWNAIYKREYLQKNKIDYFDNIDMVNDVPFTARATYFSQKSVPAVGTFYHYRKEVENQLSILDLKRVKCVRKANKITLNFINKASYKSKEDYLVAFKRCIWRYDYIFGLSIKIKDFNKEEQKKFFKEFVEEFERCKYLNDLKKDYSEPYFQFLNKKFFEDYLNYKLPLNDNSS